MKTAQRFSAVLAFAEKSAKSVKVEKYYDKKGVTIQWNNIKLPV